MIKLLTGFKVNIWFVRPDNSNDGQSESREGQLFHLRVHQIIFLPSYQVKNCFVLPLTYIYSNLCKLPSDYFRVTKLGQCWFGRTKNVYFDLANCLRSLKWTFFWLDFLVGKKYIDEYLLGYKNDFSSTHITVVYCNYMTFWFFFSLLYTFLTYHFQLCSILLVLLGSILFHFLKKKKF